MGLGAQLGRPMLVVSAMMLVGAGGVVVVVGAGGGGVLDDDVVGAGGGGVLDDDFVGAGGGGVLDDDLVDVGVLDGDVVFVDPRKVVASNVGLCVTAFGAGTLRTSPGCKSLTEIPGFAASRAATEPPCSAAILARVSPLWTMIAFIC